MPVFLRLFNLALIIAPTISDCDYIFLTGKGGKFSGGFDINVFQKIHRTGMSSLVLSCTITILKIDF